MQIAGPRSVVKAAATVLHVVPADATLVAQAWVDNQDIGFVRHEQPLQIKLTGFPFTRYGALTGHIIRIAPDIKKSREQNANFGVLAKIDRNYMMVNGRKVALSAGMQLTAEFKTGEQRIIKFVLELIVRGFKETLRER